MSKKKLPKEIIQDSLPPRPVKRRKNDPNAISFPLTTDYKKLSALVMQLQTSLDQANRENEEKDRIIEFLKEEAYTDGLTGIFNRKGLEKTFLELAQNSDGVVIMVDLDKFKPINDTFGHDAGDEAIKLAARTLAQNTRQHTDIIARLGGDEFIVVLKGVSALEAEARIDQLKTAFNSLSFDWEHNNTNVAIKIGASFGSGDFKSGDSIDTALKKADKNMYQDKKTKGHSR